MLINDNSYYNKLISNRANKILDWHAYDQPNNYLEVNSKGINLYPKQCNEISYEFNNHGFRSDNFENHADIPILFTGCSYTEGVGLPLNKVWAKRLANKLADETGKTIPFWNLALAGAGLDSIANGLYWHSINFKKQLDYIIILFPPFTRREYTYKTADIKTWFHPGSPGLEDDSKIVDSLFIDLEFIKYQSIKNLMLIDSVAKSLNAQVVYSMWDFLGTSTTNEVKIIQENVPHFHYVKYPDLKYDIDLARDSTHPGPSIHEKIRDVFWNEYLKERFK